MDRTTKTQRIQLCNLAEQAIHKFAANNADWHKYIHNVELDTMQLLRMEFMDKHNYTIDVETCRRGRKTSTAALYTLKLLALSGHQSAGFIAPREAQSITGLKYMNDAIERSEILQNFLHYENGRRQKKETHFQFDNQSEASAHGVLSQIDGSDFSILLADEIDDLPLDRFNSRFLLTMGATQKLGAGKDYQKRIQVRMFGVYQGASTATALIESKQYFLLPGTNVHLATKMGIVDAAFAERMRDILSPEQYMRQMLCINTESRNLIWESKVREAMMRGLEANLTLAGPVVNERYKKRGLVAFGYDAAGHGESDHASRHALVVIEQIGSTACVIFCKTWSAGLDDMVVKRDLMGLWGYFNPDAAMGDAYGIGMLSVLNDDLYANRLTHIDRKAVGQGESNASTWGEWAFAPIRFEGMVKHSMCQALRSLVHNGLFALPYIGNAGEIDDVAEVEDLRTLIKQMPNIKSVSTSKSYASYKMANPKLGDDLFDACCAAVWSLAVRGAAPMPTVILASSRKRLTYRS